MSYCRLPSYIFPTGDGVVFDMDFISNYDLDIFLYKLFLTRRSEFIQRIKNGKSILMNWQDGVIINSCDENEIALEQEYKEWLLNSEDELFKKLISK